MGDEKEIIEEDVEEEKDLEEITTEIEDDSFSEFMLSDTGDMPTATLESTNIINSSSEQSLEEETADAPTSVPSLGEVKQEFDYALVTNEPKYSATSEEGMAGEMRDREVMARTIEQMRVTPRRVMVEDSPELMDIRKTQEKEEGYPGDYVIDARRIDDGNKDKLPFQHERKYKELKR